MSGEPDEDELQDLREEKMEQLQEQKQGEDAQEAREAAQDRAEAKKKAILRQNLTDEARQRLNNVKMSKPQVGEQVEQQLVALAQSGRVQDKIDDDQMKELLQEITPDSQSYNIQRR